jgi:hypothetical protein
MPVTAHAVPSTTHASTHGRRDRVLKISAPATPTA